MIAGSAEHWSAGLPAMSPDPPQRVAELNLRACAALIGLVTAAERVTFVPAPSMAATVV